jgi:Fe-S-cluster-containing dehydrogenase component
MQPDRPSSHDRDKQTLPQTGPTPCPVCNLYPCSEVCPTGGFNAQEQERLTEILLGKRQP